MSEIWKSVVGYEGIYEVSDAGRIRSLDHFRGNYFRPGVMKKLSIDPHGYIWVSLSTDGVPRRIRVHPLVLTAFVGPRPSPITITRHLNGIKTDNRLCNLAWGTSSENQMDNERLGVMVTGEAHPFAKLTDEAVRRIRAGGTLQGHADERGVSIQAVYNARHRKTWKHVA